MTYPRLETALALGYGFNGGAIPDWWWMDVSTLTRQQTSTDRGRQYELDETRTGTAGVVLDNRGGPFDPDNTSSPWYPHITSYQPLRLRAQYPPTPNVLDAGTATAGDADGTPAGAVPASYPIASDVGALSIVASASAYQGGQVYQCAIPAGTAPTGLARILGIGRTAYAPGETYTTTMAVRCTTAGAAVKVAPVVLCYIPATGATVAVTGSTVTLTGAAAPSWTTVTLTWTMPANASGAQPTLALAAAPASAVVVQLDALNTNHGGTAAAFGVPGTWYPVWAGYVEQWPQTWTHAGTYGQSQLSCTDPLNWLARSTDLDQVFYNEVGLLGPRFLFALDDTTGSTTFAEHWGAYPPLGIGSSKYGTGTVTAGQDITSAGTAPADVFTGAPGPVVTITNPAYGSTSLTSAGSYLNLAGVGIAGPAPGAGWTRMIAFRASAGIPPAGASPAIWACIGYDPNASTNVSAWHLSIFPTTGYLYSAVIAPSGSQLYASPPINVCDGNWHLAVTTLSADGTTITLTLDGVEYYNSSATNYTLAGIVADSIGAFAVAGIAGVQAGFSGDIAHAAEFPTVLTADQVADLYEAWLTACADDSTGQRYARLLSWCDVSADAVTRLDVGETADMGPATDLVGTDGMSGAGAIVDTEGGNHYAARDGAYVFESRGRRWQDTRPAFVFGEDVDAGELPYEDFQPGLDPTLIANPVQATQYSTSNVYSAQDDAALEAFGSQTSQITVNAASAAEVQDHASYVAATEAVPHQRVKTITIHPGGNPALWGAALSLEISTRIRVMRRAPGAAALAIDCFVESIAWRWSPRDATCTLQLSPVPDPPAALFAAMHTTLAAAAAAGAGTLTLAPLPDSALNPASCQLVPGLALVLDVGTPAQETVTVATVATTAPGYGSVAVTLAGDTAHAHAAGAVVCEPLPAGVTDPTTYDGVGAFDAAAFAY